MILAIILHATQFAHDFVLWLASPFWAWVIILLLLKRPVQQVLTKLVVPITLLAVFAWALPIQAQISNDRYEQFVNSEMNAVSINSSCAELPQRIKGHRGYTVYKGKRWVQFRRETAGGHFERTEGKDEDFPFPGEAYVFFYMPTGLVAAQMKSEAPRISFDCGTTGRVLRMKRGNAVCEWTPECRRIIYSDGV